MLIHLSDCSSIGSRFFVQMRSSPWFRISIFFSFVNHIFIIVAQSHFVTVSLSVSECFSKKSITSPIITGWPMISPISSVFICRKNKQLIKGQAGFQTAVFITPVFSLILHHKSISFLAIFS